MPHNETPFQWHRDLPYLQHTPPNLLTCILCMDDMTKENGATVVCPGSHCIAHEEVKPTDTNMPESEVPAPRVTVECTAVGRISATANGATSSASGLGRTRCRWTQRYAYEFIAPRSKKPDSPKTDSTGLRPSVTAVFYFIK